MAFLPHLRVNLHNCLCGIPKYASAQLLDFLDLGQKFSFMNWKTLLVSIRSNSTRGRILLIDDPDVADNRIPRLDPGDSM
jgi:hypothetical protein